MKLSDSDKKKVISRYTDRYNQFGYSPLTLGWDKGKQNIRFDILTSFFNLQHSSILDIGCGFGDLNKYLQPKSIPYVYTGIDLVESLIKEAKRKYKNPNIHFICADFMESHEIPKHDVSIGSGLFNFKLETNNNYEFIESIFNKAFGLSAQGIAFDFLSDRVDFKNEFNFYSNPSTILDMAYQLSRNVILRNDYMPFEFTIIVFRDDSFSSSDTLFRRFKQSNIL